MSSLARGVFRFVGVACIILALIGLFTSFIVLFFSTTWDSSSRHPSPETPYFKTAFYVMSGISAVCCFTLFIYGISFMALKSRLYPLFVGLLIFEVVYFFIVAALWGYPDTKVSMSIGAATGIANGALMPQFTILFPLWAPFLIGRARRELQQKEQ